MHTWYMAADIQLFIVGLTILMVLWKCSSLLRPMIYFLLVVGFILPMVNVYYNSMDAVTIINIKELAFIVWYDEWFTRNYQATETHFLCYFGGVLVGIIYHKMQKDDQLLAKSKLYTVLQYTTVPMLVLVCLPAPLLQLSNFSKPSVWMSIYAGVVRLVATSFGCVGWLLLLFAQPGSFFGKLRMSNMLQNAFYRVLGRLSFGYYLIHIIVMGAIFGIHHEAMRISVGLVIIVFCSTVLITLLLSLLAYILVEKPFDIIFKQLLSSGTREKEKNDTIISQTICNNHTDIPKQLNIIPEHSLELGDKLKE
ncbi:uncharacterized protein LOC131681749 [Topomyia yanbarensis]|uniref:uncharacterized protein LOC131681749 n=1 Tax=Topomyia yanbarensis TaxID=2498891 RepID=UPI00273BA697|nr:uncharacterized protein LOC131681749 [Topomyia yanbarensis]